MGARRYCHSFINLSSKVAIHIVFNLLLRRDAKVLLSVTSGKLVQMWENAMHSSRACVGVSIAPPSQKGHKVASGSFGVHFPVLHRRLWELVQIDATFLCAEMFNGSRRYAAGLSGFSL